jgi:Leucine-rich repeat (LRR) protein
MGPIQIMREAVRVSAVMTEREREDLLACPFESVASDASLLYDLLSVSYNLSLVTPFAEEKKFQYRDLSSYHSLAAKVGAVRSFLASSEAGELQMIDGRGCHMTCLPAELCCLPSLLVLDISNNALTKIPEEIGHLSTLIILEMDGNFLLDVPACLVRLRELRTVTLSGNPCTSVPKEIKGLLPQCRFFL